MNKNIETIELIPSDILPANFEYPKEFKWLISNGIYLWRPWIIESGRSLLIRYEGLKERYPNRNLIPFASRLDCDDVACWDLTFPEKISLIHDFAKSPFEQVGWHENFWEWFKATITDTIEFAKKDLI
jgi:hypothetical protein